MSPNHKFSPQVTSWLLRLGLAFVFAYASISSLMHPLEWVNFLPPFLTEHISGQVLVGFFAIYEAILVVWLISGYYLRYAAILCALTLAGIVVSSPSQLITTFRDVGLVFMALALSAFSA